MNVFRFRYIILRNQDILRCGLTGQNRYTAMLLVQLATLVPVGPVPQCSAYAFLIILVTFRCVSLLLARGRGFVDGKWNGVETGRGSSCIWSDTKCDIGII